MFLSIVEVESVVITVNSLIDSYSNDVVCKAQGRREGDSNKSVDPTLINLWYKQSDRPESLDDETEQSQ